MSLRQHALAVALFCSLAAPPLAAEPLAGSGDVIRLRNLGDGLVAAPVSIGGESLWMLLDTGATRSMLRAEVAARLHLKPRARFRLETTLGATEGFCAGPVTARVGTTDLEVDCLGWSAGVDEASLGPDVDGILAADALALRPVLIDLTAGRLHIGLLLHEIEGHEVPLALEAGRPTLTLRNGRGTETLRLVLDSGAEHLVLFGRAAAAVLPVQGAALETLVGSRRTGVGAAPRLRQLRRQPRHAILLPDLTGRGEDGLLPLTSVGRVALDWQRGVAILAAR